MRLRPYLLVVGRRRRKAVALCGADLSLSKLASDSAVVVSPDTVEP